MLAQAWLDLLHTHQINTLEAYDLRRYYFYGMALEIGSFRTAWIASDRFEGHAMIQMDVVLMLQS
jgi:hypothetical protein